MVDLRAVLQYIYRWNKQAKLSLKGQYTWLAWQELELQAWRVPDRPDAAHSRSLKDRWSEPGPVRSHPGNPQWLEGWLVPFPAPDGKLESLRGVTWHTTGVAFGRLVEQWTPWHAEKYCKNRKLHHRWQTHREGAAVDLHRRTCRTKNR